MAKFNSTIQRNKRRQTAPRYGSRCYASGTSDEQISRDIEAAKATGNGGDFKRERLANGSTRVTWRWLGLSRSFGPTGTL